MDRQLIKASNKVLSKNWFFLERVEDLKTKIRFFLRDGYYLDAWFSSKLERYSYVLIKEGRRILGWDNAPYHKNKTFPHHFHSGELIEESKLSGDAIKDLYAIFNFLNKWLKA